MDASSRNSLKLLGLGARMRVAAAAVVALALVLVALALSPAARAAGALEGATETTVAEASVPAAVGEGTPVQAPTVGVTEEAVTPNPPATAGAGAGAGSGATGEGTTQGASASSAGAGTTVEQTMHETVHETVAAGDSAAGQATQTGETTGSDLGQSASGAQAPAGTQHDDANPPDHGSDTSSPLPGATDVAGEATSRVADRAQVSLHEAGSSGEGAAVGAGGGSGPSAGAPAATAPAQALAAGAAPQRIDGVPVRILSDQIAPYPATAALIASVVEARLTGAQTHLGVTGAVAHSELMRVAEAAGAPVCPGAGIARLAIDGCDPPAGERFILPELSAAAGDDDGPGAVAQDLHAVVRAVSGSASSSSATFVGGSSSATAGAPGFAATALLMFAAIALLGTPCILRRLLIVAERWLATTYALIPERPG